jgi:hypothetical protein
MFYIVLLSRRTTLGGGVYPHSIPLLFDIQTHIQGLSLDRFADQAELQLFVLVAAELHVL